MRRIRSNYYASVVHIALQLVDAYGLLTQQSYDAATNATGLRNGDAGLRCKLLQA